MHYSKRSLITILLLVLFILAGIAILILLFEIIKTRDTEDKKAPPPPKTQKEDFSVTAWIPYWDQENAIKSATENITKLDAIGVFWYKLTPEGTVTVYEKAIEDQRFIEFAHENDVKVYALVANLPEEGEETTGWDPERVENVISNEDQREKHINDLVNLVIYKNFDGLALDYENLRPEQKDNFSLFIQELAQALHQQQKSLEIAIHPKTSENPNTEFSGALAQDYQKIAQYADHLHFMMYTQHGRESKPGPSSTPERTEAALNYAIEKLHIPKEKIIMGIGLFGLEWQVEGNGFTGVEDDLTYNQVENFIEQNKTDMYRDENSQSVEITFRESNTFHVIWINDAKSIKRRIQIAKNYDVGGVSLWRLGGEDPEIWNFITK